jgi:hypothetical protein
MSAAAAAATSFKFRVSTLATTPPLHNAALAAESRNPIRGTNAEQGI